MDVGPISVRNEKYAGLERSGGACCNNPILSLCFCHIIVILSFHDCNIPFISHDRRFGTFDFSILMVLILRITGSTHIILIK